MDFLEICVLKEKLIGFRELNSLCFYLFYIQIVEFNLVFIYK